MPRVQPSLALVFSLLAAPHVAFAQDELPSAADAAGGSQKRADITPYIQASQVLQAELSPGNDVVTYSSLAAGVDAQITGRRTQAAVSVRYERRIGWGDDAPDGDVISGIARVSAGIVPRTLTLEAGAMAAQTRVDGNGAVTQSSVIDGTGRTDVYALYAGPRLQTQIGQMQVDGHYRIGYTRVEEPDALVTAPDADPIDVFDESIAHDAQIHTGIRPGVVLPVGVGLGAGFYQEDMSNLDQRVRNVWFRADATLPVTPNLALVGGVGYEDLEVSNRDALLDDDDQPVVGDDGRYVTDKNTPRIKSYDVSGLIWDAGVVWRPSRRTTLEAHVARRYGSMSYYGSLSYQPNSRSHLYVSVYDSMSGFGGQMNNTLAALPTDFEATRNPISGNVTDCVVALEDDTCVGSSLTGLRSSVFRARGITATYGVKLGRLQAGLGAGYDRRKYVGADGTILEAYDGLSDENVWVAAYLSGELDRRSSFQTNVYANWFDSEFNATGSTLGYGASAAYFRTIASRISASAAVSIDGLERDEDLEDLWTAAAMVGLRYSF